MKVTANGTEFDTRLEGPDGAPVVTLSHSLCCDLSAWDELGSQIFPSRAREQRCDTGAL